MEGGKRMMMKRQEKGRIASGAIRALNFSRISGEAITRNIAAGGGSGESGGALWGKGGGTMPLKGEGGGMGVRHPRPKLFSPPRVE